MSEKLDKQKSKKSILVSFLIFIILGNFGFYMAERDKWITENQPYKEAKEWLIPANIMLVYGTAITRLPFIDEISLIAKPIINIIQGNTSDRLNI